MSVTMSRWITLRPFVLVLLLLLALGLTSPPLHAGGSAKTFGNNMAGSRFETFAKGFANSMSQEATIDGRLFGNRTKFVSLSLSSSDSSASGTVTIRKLSGSDSFTLEASKTWSKDKSWTLLEASGTFTIGPVPITTSGDISGNVNSSVTVDTTPSISTDFQSGLSLSLESGVGFTWVNGGLGSSFTVLDGKIGASMDPSGLDGQLKINSGQVGLNLFVETPIKDWTYTLAESDSISSTSYDLFAGNSGTALSEASGEGGASGSLEDPDAPGDVADTYQSLSLPVQGDGGLNGDFTRNGTDYNDNHDQYTFDVSIGQYVTIAHTQQENSSSFDLESDQSNVQFIRSKTVKSTTYRTYRVTADHAMKIDISGNASDGVSITYELGITVVSSSIDGDMNLGQDAWGFERNISDLSRTDRSTLRKSTELVDSTTGTSDTISGNGYLNGLTDVQDVYKVKVRPGNDATVEFTGPETGAADITIFDADRSVLASHKDVSGIKVTDTVSISKRDAFPEYLYIAINTYDENTEDLYGLSVTPVPDAGGDLSTGSTTYDVPDTLSSAKELPEEHVGTGQIILDENDSKDAYKIPVEVGECVIATFTQPFTFDEGGYNLAFFNDDRSEIKTVTGVTETTSETVVVKQDGYLYITVEYTGTTQFDTEYHLSTKVVRCDGGCSDAMVSGLGAGSNGFMEFIRDRDGSFAPMGWPRVQWSAYNAGPGETRPALGDTDGDGLDELITGLVGPDANGYFEVVDAGDRQFPHVRWVRVNWSAYNASDGNGTHPATGDVDGDGLDEVIVGLDGGTGNGFLEVFDDASTGYEHLTWIRVNWPDYNSENGRTLPAAGDVDDDGEDEIIVGLGSEGDGWFELFDATEDGFSHLAWERIDWSAYNNTSGKGETRPATGDMDGDQIDEIAVGIESFSTSGGWIELMDDATEGYKKLNWIRIPWPNYNSTDGRTHPAAGDLDCDGLAEVASGLGPPGKGWLAIFEDIGSSWALMRWKQVSWSNYATSSDASTYPDIESDRE